MDPSAPRRIGVVSGRYPASRFEAYVNHRAYCARHGYTYIYCNWPTGEHNRYMNKLAYVRAYIGLFDYLFWIDDDAFFMDLERPLERLLPGDGQFLSICKSPANKAIHTYVSSGQFALRCDDTGRAFVDAVMGSDMAEVRAWWTPELGYFSNGDQDAMVHLMLTDPRFARVARHDAEAFNSRYGDLTAGRPVFILHFTGTEDVKRRHYLGAQLRLGRGPSLLPREEAARWNLVPRRRDLPRRAVELLRARLGGGR
jgi:hypothetical protein